MKKDKTNEGTDKRKMSKLEKENAQLKAQNEQLKSDNKQLRSELGRERKKRRESNRTEQRTGTITLEPVERYTFSGFLIFAALLNISLQKLGRMDRITFMRTYNILYY